MPLSHIFISKNRKVEFEINILIEDLTNVPLVSGFFLVKWKLKNAEHSSGSTSRSPIRDHTIFWGHSISTAAEMIISKKEQHELGPCEFKLEVYQDNVREMTPIGSLDINLSEYASSGLTTRRYLLDVCKFNSTIKLSIRVDQISETDANFNIPPLKKQQIFTDIPSMITERQERSTPFDERSSQTLPNHTISSLEAPSSSPIINKSQSVVSLANYCHQISPFDDPDDPSPTDLVEQLFKPKQ